MLTAITLCLSMLLPSADRPIVIAIHGGAGTIARSTLSAAEEAQYRAMLGKALDAGYAVLEGGGTSLDAVETVIVLLEDSPLFNAGKGSVFTAAETIEMDASIMDGATGKAGAVAGVTTAKNPIKAARAVMTGTKHVLLAAAGADRFVAQSGLETRPAAYFRTERRRKQLREIQGRAKGKGKHGTVGAVALDRRGNLAAGTSTGGMTNKRFGRVGDSPIPGAGTWARNATAAVSCTGHGEFFIREAAAHSVSARMALAGQTLAQAAKAVIFEQLKPIGGSGGLIAVDRAGGVALEYNTGGMYRGFRHSDGRREIRIWER